MKKRVYLLGWALIAVFIIAVLEVAGWVGLSALEKKPMSYGALTDELAGIASVDEHPIAADETSPPVEWGVQQIHPYMGFVMYPLKQAVVHLTNDDNMEDYGFGNDNGPLLRSKNPNQTVVLIMGGSVAYEFARNKPAIALFTKELQKIPRFKGHEIIIDAAGYYGYKEPQHLMALTYLLSLGGKFDIAISLDGFNEVAITKPNVVDPGAFLFYPDLWFYRMEENNGDETVRTLIGGAAYARERRVEGARYVQKLPRSMFVGLLWKMWDKRAQGEIAKREADLAAYQPRKRGNFAARGPEITFDSDNDYYSAIVGMWKRTTVQLQKLASANGIHFFHFLQPNQYFPGSKQLSADEKTNAFDPNSAYKPGVENGYPMLRETVKELQQEGVTSTDLTQLFAKTKESTYYDMCCHVNDRGNAMLARAMADVIAKKLQATK